MNIRKPSILSSITAGLAGWLTYEDMCRNVRHHRESTLHDPIRDIARANDYSVCREFPLPRHPGSKGAPKQVDFVLTSEKHREAVVLELKFKKSAKALAGSISGDARKIASVDLATLNETIAARPALRLPECGADWSIKRGVLLVWREGDIADALLDTREHPIIRKQLMELVKGLCPDPAIATPRQMAEAFLSPIPVKPVSNTAGHLRFGSTLTRKRYWAGLLVRRPSWLKL